jgi:hypothetical protein
MRQRQSATVVTKASERSPTSRKHKTGTMMLLQACSWWRHVFLNEERARAVLGRSPDDVDAAWYLDTGASNHMTGDEAAFAELDKSVSGTVKFGDGSLVAIKGHATVFLLSLGMNTRH